jgi:hypothetical protein
MTAEPVAMMMWENSADTPLDSSHLSKAIDFQSDSKFINYINDVADYTLWADQIITTAWPSAPTDQQINRTVYNTTDNTAKIGQKSGASYTWLSTPSPYQRLLKINARSKFALTYTNATIGNLVYANFDVGQNPLVISIESLLMGTDFSKSTNYEIFLYWLNSYGNQAYFKIVKTTDDTANTYNWKQGGVSAGDTAIDSTSPTGYKLIALRLVGGFRTTSDTIPQIDPVSVWDISTLHTEVTSQSYKIFDTNLLQTRSLQASDIPIVDSTGVYNAANTENALQEVKLIVNQLNQDVYNNQDRFGVELKWSGLKYVATASPVFQPTLTGELSLKITAGYIDVVGRRVLVDYNPQATISNPSLHDVYLASADTSISVNGAQTQRGILLGQQGIYPGIWRIYIDQTGQINLKDSTTLPKYSSGYHGWYDMTTGARCIGKFNVVNNGGFYIEKMSIINTYDENIQPNVIIMVHGTMCPDGLVPCDGMWHDINGYNQNSYPNMPLYANATDPSWVNGSWWEETPNMWGRVPKMIGNDITGGPVLPFTGNRFTYTAYDAHTASIVSGGSADCGASSGTDVHTHTYNHTHLGGTLSTSDPGTHDHKTADVNIYPPESTSQVVGGTGIYVASSSHIHSGTIVHGGGHTHTPPFNGSTDNSNPTATDSASSWAPYKEILFCIKK